MASRKAATAAPSSHGSSRRRSPSLLADPASAPRTWATILSRCPPAAPRALAQLGRGAGHHPVERRPGPLEQGGEAFRLLIAQRPAVAGGLPVRSAEVGGGGAGKALDHLELLARAGRQREPGRLGHDRIAGRRRCQRLQRLLLTLARTA